MTKLFIVLGTIFSMMTVALQAEVTISSASYQQVIKKDKSGKKVKQWVKATKVVPGTEVRYYNTLKNKGKDQAQKLVVVNAIPKHMQYIKGTAKCKSKCKITYSVDGGKTFNKPKKLFVGKGKKRHRAKASEYTTIQWVVDTLAGEEKTVVEYKARLE